MSKLKEIEVLKATWEELWKRDLLEEWKQSPIKDIEESDLGKSQRIREQAIEKWAELTSELMSWTFPKLLINSTQRQEIIDYLEKGVNLPNSKITVIYMPNNLNYELYHALRALEMGEIKPLLCANNATGKHSPYTMLQENDYISSRFSYLLGASKTKTSAEQEIASEGVINFISADAVRKRIKREKLSISLLPFCYGALENNIPYEKAFISAQKHMKWLKEHTFKHVWKLVSDKL
jgi:hypothetical protein